MTAMTLTEKILARHAGKNRQAIEGRGDSRQIVVFSRQIQALL